MMKDADNWFMDWNTHSKALNQKDIRLVQNHIVIVQEVAKEIAKEEDAVALAHAHTRGHHLHAVVVIK